MSSKCISSKQTVRTRQQGLQCDGCSRWQHQTCGTRITLSDYRAAVQTDASIDWRCETCMFESSLVPVAESTPVDFAADSVVESVINDSTDNNESTVYEPVTDPAALDESLIYDPPAAVEGNDFAVTYQILQDSTTKGRPKLVDSRGYCYNIKRRRPNATDWQCTIRRKVNIVT